MQHIRLHLLYIIAATLLALSSCSTPKDIVYFQDIQGENSYKVPVQTIKIKPDDKIGILVNSRDRQLTDQFTLSYSPRYIGSTTTSYGTNQGLPTYTVNPEGNIDFPLLGSIHVAGMTRVEIAAMIKGMLISKDLVRDPIVTVELTNSVVTVIGEVNKPGTYSINSDNMTILDAIGVAGDLTIYGKRENIKLVRNEGDRQETYVVSLLDAEKLRNSPAYYVQQNDVIYIDPNNTRLRQGTSSGNTILTPTFWLSIASFAFTMATVLIINK